MVAFRGRDTLYTNNKREIVPELLYMLELNSLIEQQAQLNKYHDY